MPINNNIYNVLWKKISRWLTANGLAFPKVMALIYALISALNDLHTRFQYFRNYCNYRLAITPQVVYLEKLLNDRFDVVDRRIRIVKGIEYPALPLFLKSENKPQTLYNRRRERHQFKIFYTKSETEQFTVDFIVRVPIQVPFDMNELTAYLDIDVLPSKVYKVQIV